MALKQRATFNLSSLFKLIAIVSFFFGAGSFLLIAKRDSHRAAILHRQCRELSRVNARFKKCNGSQLLCEIDFTSSRIEEKWIVSRFEHWEYRSVSKVIFFEDQLSLNGIKEISKQLLNGEVVVRD